MRRLIPPNFHDPIGLLTRIVRSRDPAALFAIVSTVLSALATPLDCALAPWERRLYALAAQPQLPIVIVTGAPRSGTTLVSQVLRAHLPVGYFNNLTAVFPRAPIVANRMFARLLRPRPPTYHSFYGRTRGFAEQNDGLHLWDRWLGEDRYAPPVKLDASVTEDMRRFFAAYEAILGKPLLTKNNALATTASTIARALPTSHFVVVRRDLPYAAQSILHAREVVQGSRTVPYGVSDPQHRVVRTDAASPIEAVCAQLVYHERRMHEQHEELGPTRFHIVEYEAFCREPERLVERVGREILGITVDTAAVRAALPAFRSTNRVTVSAAEFAEIQSRLASLGTPGKARNVT